MMSSVHITALVEMLKGFFNYPPALQGECREIIL